MSVTTSSKRSQSKTKNNLASSVHIFEDPRFKEYETIPIEKFKLDKEKAQRDYNQLQNDLINLKEEYIKTKQRAADRETELRSHINNLLIKSQHSSDTLLTLCMSICTSSFPKSSSL